MGQLPLTFLTPFQAPARPLAHSPALLLPDRLSRRRPREIEDVTRCCKCRGSIESRRGLLTVGKKEGDYWLHPRHKDQVLSDVREVSSKYMAIRPLCRKVLKASIWGIPPAGGPLL